MIRKMALWRRHGSGVSVRLLKLNSLRRLLGKPVTLIRNILASSITLFSHAGVAALC